MQLYHNSSKMRGLAQRPLSPNRLLWGLLWVLCSSSAALRMWLTSFSENQQKTASTAAACQNSEARAVWFGLETRKSQFKNIPPQHHSVGRTEHFGSVDWVGAWVGGSRGCNRHSREAHRYQARNSIRTCDRSRPPGRHTGDQPGASARGWKRS